jgi:hypothetical protein
VTALSPIASLLAALTAQLPPVPPAGAVEFLDVFGDIEAPDEAPELSEPQAEPKQPKEPDITTSAWIPVPVLPIAPSEPPPAPLSLDMPVAVEQAPFDKPSAEAVGNLCVERSAPADPARADGFTETPPAPALDLPAGPMLPAPAERTKPEAAELRQLWVARNSVSHSDDAPEPEAIEPAGSEPRQPERATAPPIGLPPLPVEVPPEPDQHVANPVPPVDEQASPDPVAPVERRLVPPDREGMRPALAFSARLTPSRPEFEVAQADGSPREVAHLPESDRPQPIARPPAMDRPHPIVRPQAMDASEPAARPQTIDHPEPVERPTAAARRENRPGPVSDEDTPRTPAGKPARSEPRPAPVERGSAARDVIVTPPAHTPDTSEAAEPTPAIEPKAPAPKVATPSRQTPAAPPIARDIRLEVGSPDRKVEVRLVERAGEVRVAVRTPDDRLAEGLREQLPQLSSRLEQSGFHADEWRAAAPGGAERRLDVEDAAAGSPDTRQQGSPHDRGQERREGEPRAPRDQEQQSRRNPEKGTPFAWLMESLR